MTRGSPHTHTQQRLALRQPIATAYTHIPAFTYIGLMTVNGCKYKQSLAIKRRDYATHKSYKCQYICYGSAHMYNQLIIMKQYTQPYILNIPLSNYDLYTTWSKGYYGNIL